MTSKFYLHRDTTTDTGTLPATNATISAALTPTWTPGQTNSVATTPLLTNFSMDGTISAVAQTSLAYATDNISTAQQQPLLRFCSVPIAAQTIAAQDLRINGAVQQSNTNSAFSIEFVIGLWRPSSGSLAGLLADPSTGGIGANLTAETANATGLFLSSAVTAQDGDILLIEVWRTAGVQAMSTSYTNTVFYDGTVEDSATDNAAYLLFTNDVALFVPSTGIPPGLGPVVGLHPMMDMSSMMR